jgi:NADPH:quinone reductase-like Zn-dependent oxidoreductase
MALEIAIRSFGGPDVLEARDVPPQAPREGQIARRRRQVMRIE